MKRKLSQTTLYLIAISLFLLTVNVSLSFVLTKQSDRAIREQIESRMLDVSNTAAAMLDGEDLAALQAEDVDTPQYQAILRTLSYFQDNIDLEYIYCIRDLGNKQFIFTIDPSEDPGAFGEAIAYTDALYAASLGTPSVDKTPYEDRWGRFYSAYTPVLCENGEIAAIVAVDFSAQWYEEQVFNQLRTTVLMSVLSLVFAGAIIVMVAARYRRRFQVMLREMNAVSERIETLVQEVSPGPACVFPERSEEVDLSDGVTELSRRIVALEDHLSEQIAFVRSRAFIDGLTRLGNRAAYEEHVKRLDDDIRDGRAAFSVALFDLNGLKQLNDRCGHQQGDQAIVSVAAALEQVFPDGKLYRIGGDEFIAVLEQTVDAFTDRFDRVDALLAQDGLVSVSKGFAVFRPGEDQGYRVVFNRADYAMYEDKRAYYQSHGDRRRTQARIVAAQMNPLSPRWSSHNN